MLIQRDFVWGYDMEHFRDGLKPVSIPQFDFGTPVHVAHDLMEHPTYDDASLENELEASGGSIFMRGDLLGEETYNFEENAKSVMSDTAIFIAGDKRPIKTAPQQPPISSVGEKLLLMIEDSMQTKYAQSILNEPNGDLKQVFFGDELRVRIEAAKDWIRMGYHAQKAKMPNLTPRARARLFSRIKHSIIEFVDGNTMVAGDVVHATVDGEAATVSFTITKNPEVKEAAREAKRTEELRKMRMAEMEKMIFGRLRAA